jgi:hypothetical protein
LLLLIGWVSNPPSGFEQRTETFLGSFPGALNVLWRVGMGALSLWALFLMAASLVRLRLDVLRDQVLAVLGSLVAVELIYRLAGWNSASLWRSAFALGPPPERVSVRVALAVAAIVTISPHLTRPFRWGNRWLVFAGALSAGLGEQSTPSGVVLGLSCGAASAAVVHLTFGSSGGRPRVSDVRLGLADMGVIVSSLSEATRQRAGVFELAATGLDGKPLLVRVYGRDAWDAQLMVKAWRALWYRDAESFLSPGSSRSSMRASSL